MGPKADPGAVEHLDRHESLSPVFVVILGYGDSTRAVALAQGLVRQGWDPAALTVVLNPAGRTPVEVDDPGLPVMVMDQNLGYAGGMNAGIELGLARGSTSLALLTHDCLIDASQLLALSRHLDEHADVGVVGPVLVSPSSGEVISGGGSLGGHDVDHDRSRPDPATARACDWLDGSALVVRSVALEAVGAFDPRYFMYAEDVDLCFRLRRAGWGCAVVGDVVASQEFGSAGRGDAYIYLRTRNLVETLAKTMHPVTATRFTLAMVRSAWPHLVRAPEARGLRAAALRRFGPPPADLLVGTDISV